MYRFILLVLAMITAPALAQVNVYVGSRMTNPTSCATFCCLEDGASLINYEEAGLVVSVDDTKFNFIACGLSDSAMYYPNGGVNSQFFISRTGAAPFGRMEMRVSEGWGSCDVYLWIQVFRGGSLRGDFALNANSGEVIGIEGEADVVLISAYFDAATRDQFNPANLNALVIDDLCFEDLNATLSLSITGDCPGRNRFVVTRATANNRVALVYGFGDGPTIIPNNFTCAGTSLSVGAPSLGYQVVATDRFGQVDVSANIGADACGRLRVQALDLATCRLSNVVRK